MKTALSTSDVFSQVLSSDHTLKLTALRKEVLRIFIQAKKPISAYEALDRLKKKRDSAEPPTVYRVIEYFVEKKIIHRIDAENKYVFCSQLGRQKSEYHGIIFLCKKCLISFEVMDKSYADFLKTLSDHHHFSIDDSVIEIKGICKKCATA